MPKNGIWPLKHDEYSGVMIGQMGRGVFIGRVRARRYAHERARRTGYWRAREGRLI